MSLYIGNSEKLKITLGEVKYNMHIVDKLNEIAKLFSADNYVLKDSQGLYLIPKESE